VSFKKTVGQLNEFPSIPGKPVEVKVLQLLMLAALGLATLFEPPTKALPKPGPTKRLLLLVLKGKKPAVVNGVLVCPTKTA
jgi:hypothetical protein